MPTFAAKSSAVLLALALVLLATPLCLRAQDDSAAEAGSSDSAESPAASTVDSAARKQAQIDQMVQTFVAIYDQMLQSDDWMTRVFAVISLARIDDPRTTARLLEVVEKDRLSLVRVYAFEALYARAPALDDDARKRWIAAALDLARRNQFHGDLRAGFIRAIGAQGPTSDNVSAFLNMFASTNALDPADIRTLQAMRDVLGQWRSREITRKLIAVLTRLDDAYRAEYVLQGLNAGVPDSRSFIDQGTREMWPATQQAWAAWYRGANLSDDKDPTPGRIDKGSSLIEHPEKITDTADPRWRKDLELGKLRLDQLDVTFCVDSTGSMGPVVAWIQHDVPKMLRAFAIISREPRIGVTFYRDHGDAYVTQVHELTADGTALARAISGVDAKGGDDVPEAVLEALTDAVTKQKWSRGAGAKKVIITVADAPPHPETMPQVEILVKKAADNGFIFHVVKARTEAGGGDLSNLEKIAAWGKGKTIELSFWNYTPSTEAAGSGNNNTVHTRIASPNDNNVDREVVAAVMAGILNASYHDRIEPFVNVLLEYVELPTVEKRQPFGQKPADPQYTVEPIRTHKEEPKKETNPQKRGWQR